MKYLVLLGVLLVALLLWKSSQRRSSRTGQDASRPADQALPRSMAVCQHCGVHFPAADAVKGQHGTYCSPEHLRQREG